ncbi:hypothetical protein LNTAR_16568 [Lentisphaera araneosa HTCC2155]|uniref:Uncharacterized protein n=1 Tax=Lentisphaera araneosa HTCC2155 TaxID=313628 RepID=A6DQC8_9BACT|nr:hypothetical protein LNTAR_16568 [Lentisphaera araneosa HTCC2155]
MSLNEFDDFELTLESMEMLLSRYAELNPQAAINYFETNVKGKKEGYSAISAIMSSWTKDDPLAALDWCINKKIVMVDSVK